MSGHNEIPLWFGNLLNKALQHGDRHEEYLESVLGISRLVYQGKETEAQRLGEQLNAAIEQTAIYPGENRSTQLARMMGSGCYPPEICEVIAQKLGFSSVELFTEQRLPPGSITTDHL